jgi:ligand-binding sensor domain-containing protein
MITPGSGFRFLRFLLLTGVFFIGIITAASSQSFNFRHITKEQGLSGIEIYKAIQDRNGYIWCVTDAGVFKYNGSEFRIFTQEDGLPGLTFYAIHEDQYGLIWVSCSNGQVGYFKDSKYYSITANATITKLLMNGQRLIYEIFVDSGDTLWLGTQHRLLKVSPERNYATASEVNSNRTNSVRLIREVDNGIVVTSLDYNTDKSKTRKVNNGTEFASDIVLQMRNGTFTFEHTWDAQLGSTSLLSAISLDDSCILIGFGNKLIKWHRDNTREVYQFDNRVLKLVTDEEKNLWICFDKNGVKLFRNGDLKSTPVHLLQDVSVANILVDKEKNLWVSTLGNGLMFSPTLQIQYFGNIAGLEKGIVALGTIKDKVLAITAADQGFAFDSVGKSSMVFDFTSSFTLGAYKIRNFDSITFVVGSRTGFLTKDLKLPYPMMEEGNYLYSQDYFPLAKDTDLILVHSEIRIYSKGEMLRKYPLPGRGLNLFVLSKGKYLIGTLNGLYLFEDEKFKLLILRASRPCISDQFHFL